MPRLGDASGSLMAPGPLARQDALSSWGKVGGWPQALKGDSGSLAVLTWPWGSGRLSLQAYL